MSIINSSTFVASADQPEHGYWVSGTVEVTLRNETRRVEANKKSTGEITAFGMTGRYVTGTKAWSASVTQHINSDSGQSWDCVFFGRDDRTTKFRKANMLSFA